MDKDQVKKLFANPQVCNGCVSMTVSAWNVMAKEVDKFITALEKENMDLQAELEALARDADKLYGENRKLQAELEAMGDVKELQAVGLPGVNIETMNVTVNCYAEL